MPRSGAEPSAQHAPWWAWAVRGLVLAAAMGFLVRGVRWRDIAVAVGRAGIVLPAVVIGMNACMMGLRAWRLRTLLDRRLSFGAAFITLLTSSALNNITPLRGGQVARLWMIERASGVTKSAALAVTLVESLLEVAILAVLGFAAAWLANGQTWALVATPLAFLVTVVTLGLLLTITRRAARGETCAPANRRGWLGKLQQLLIRAQPGFRALCKPGTAWRAVLLSLLAWACEATMVLVCGRAMGLSVSFPLAVIVLFGINLALTLPSTPASAGPFEGATVAVLLFAGIAKGPAVAFAFFYHAIQVVPVTVVGATALLLAKRGQARGPGPEGASGIPATKLESR